MKKLLAIVALSALAALGAGGISVANAQQGQSGSAERGYESYVKNGCYACHGYAGQGGGAGPRLAPDPRPLFVLRAYVRSPTGVMPAYSAKVLSDEVLADIHAYLQTIPPPPAERPAILRPRN